MGEQEREELDLIIKKFSFLLATLHSFEELSKEELKLIGFSYVVAGWQLKHTLIVMRKHPRESLIMFNIMSGNHIVYSTIDKTDKAFNDVLENLNEHI